MRTTPLVAILLVGASLVSTAGPSVAGPPVSAGMPGPTAPGPYVAGELLVAPAAGVSDAALEQGYHAHGGTLIGIISGIGVHHIRVPAAAQDAIEAALQRDPQVKFVEKNFLLQEAATPNDPYYAKQWHLPKISAPTGWDVSKGSTAVPIAIVDSGVDATHPDLAAKLLRGWNYTTGTSNTDDTAGHGTAVAGTAAAITNDALGVAGVAWLNPIMPFVVATYADDAAAFTYAADHGAKVINCSFGGSSYSSTLQSAVDYAWNKGLVIVAAAGNANSDTPMYPAALSHVVAVAATDQDDQKASFSNYGSWIDLAAPGTYIYTTDVGGGYGAWQGTSFSSPQVAGLAALVFSANPKLTNAQVVSLMESSADDLGAGGYDVYFGWGRINVGRTLQAAVTTTSTTSTDTTPPTVAITSPASGSTVLGTVSVQASASDNVGVATVQLYVDSVLQGADSTSPYTFSWNTTGLSGSHTLVAVATDAAGNSATSAPVSVTVGTSSTSSSTSSSSTLTVSITSLVYDGKFLTVTVSASDFASTVTQVALLVDGAVKATDTSAPWAFKLNTRSWASGSHTIQAKAYDAAGLTALSASKTFIK